MSRFIFALAAAVTLAGCDCTIPSSTSMPNLYQGINMHYVPIKAACKMECPKSCCSAAEAPDTGKIVLTADETDMDATVEDSMEESAEDIVAK